MNEKYYYFGQDADGCFAENDQGERHYMAREQWMDFIHAANVKAPEPTHRVRLKIVEHISVDVHEAGKPVRSVALTPDITEI